MNLLIVFILTGFWHGASWNFLIWGLFHGFFLVVERAGLSRGIGSMWKPMQHLYLLFVVIVGWVFFRADNLSLATEYLAAMFDIHNMSTTHYQFAMILTNEAILAFIVGAVLATPIYKHIGNKFSVLSGDSVIRVFCLVEFPRFVILALLLFISIIKMSASTYNPFIYFRF